MKEITTNEVKLMQYDRNSHKNVEYSKDLDEGVWLRNYTKIHIKNIDYLHVVDDDKNHEVIVCMVDVNIDSLIKDKRDDVIKMLQENIISESWKFLLHNYPLTQNEKDNYEEVMHFCGESAYLTLLDYWNSLDIDTKNDILEKNKVKVIEEEINLNEVLKH